VAKAIGPAYPKERQRGLSAGAEAAINLGMETDEVLDRRRRREALLRERAEAQALLERVIPRRVRRARERQRYLLSTYLR
jgi:hypothetical protein